MATDKVSYRLSTASPIILAVRDYICATVKAILLARNLHRTPGIKRIISIAEVVISEAWYVVHLEAYWPVLLQGGVEILSPAAMLSCGRFWSSLPLNN